METKPILCGAPIIDIERSRYDELLAKEARLKALEKAINNLTFYNNEFDIFKKIFGLGGNE